MTAEVLNLSPDVRKLLGSIWFLALFPPHVKSYQDMFKPLVDMYASLRPGGSGVRVWDAHQRRVRTIYVVLAWIVNDIRGVPNTGCGSHPPCYVGSCMLCTVRGVRVHAKTAIILPGTVTHLSSDDSRRQCYAEEFRSVPAMVALSTQGRPRKRTRIGCIRSGERAARDGDYVREAFKDVDEFTKQLEYHNKAEQTVYDLAHEIANNIKDSINVAANGGRLDKSKKAAFSAARRLIETQVGR